MMKSKKTKPGYESILTPERKAEIQAAAKTAIKENGAAKDDGINMRVSSELKEWLIQQAKKEGLDYQPYVRMMLTRLMNGKLVDAGDLREFLDKINKAG